ncbi:PAS domain S-box protein [Erythrobacter vulgaris]|uniref:histidine kinase n=1 Tax=Qipengyuania vulgaris TaxID=291985 RepID=A0A844XMW8_9SPHN|nr:histidine kinase dimerization/phosphoacceptor domain -containing protein [Qipengyuania vulgaris]MXO47515.1 PAS domain S-box protein [Qipengyuania vulgaris]
MPLRETLPMTASQLGLIVEDAASEIYIFSVTDFAFLLVNRGARENLGYTFEELRNLTPWDLKPELSEAQFREKVRPLLESDSGDLVFETVHQRKDGSLYDVSVHLQLLRQDDGRIFFAAIRDITHENKLKQALVQRGEELEQALASREVLLQEVNHRVKNSLQVVTALLQLHAREVKDDNLKAALLDARNRIAVVASIHQRLYMNGEHSLVDVAEFLEELVTATIRSLSIQDKISTKLDLQHGISLGIDRAVPLALVVAELLTNSLKYAFAEKEKGTVGIDLNSDDSAITVRIYDDGMGFAQAEPVSSQAGLGTKIIRALSKQIRATLSEKSGQDGTEVTLVMPLT